MSSTERVTRSRRALNTDQMADLHQSSSGEGGGRALAASSQQQETATAEGEGAGRGGMVSVDVARSSDESGGSETLKQQFEIEGASSDHEGDIQTREAFLAEPAPSQDASLSSSLAPFVNAPADIFAELARTAKIFRSFLLSRSARPVFAASRLNAGLPTLQAVKMTEVQYAVLLFGENLCHYCHERSGDYDTLRFLIVCAYCRPEILVEELEAKTTLSHKYHPETFFCVPFIQMSHNWASPPCLHFLRGDLEKTSAELTRLQQADDQEAEENSTIASRTRGAKKSKLIKLGARNTERVDKFVAEQRGYWDEVRLERESMIAALRIFEAEEWAAGAELRERLAAEAAEKERARVAQQKADLLEIGWSEEDYARHANLEFTFPTSNFKAPKEDAAAWIAIRDNEIQYLERMAITTAQLERENALRTRRLARKVLVKEQHVKLMNAEDAIDQLAFPRFSIFSKFPSVAAFWIPDPAVEQEGGEEASKALLKKDGKLAEWINRWNTPTLDEGAWNAQLSKISQDVEDYRRAVDAYSVVISSFVLIETKLPPPSPTTKKVRVEAPELILNSHPSLYAHIVKGGASPEKMTLQGARALYAILELAGLDKDTATTKDLDDFGYIKWIEYSRAIRLQVWRWRDLVNHAIANPSFSRNQPMTIVRAVPKLGRWYD
ncbi:hypothetical protein BCR35DRAFT_330981 [Leucosporidium creatinivorum]|uniref:Uncharacterized protein n=1 Tax=Leucosporidium creatinivorum TaxID=106004 RepID=A0A1Y2FL67_9BASI|nr:hypothetical protein BCR35DRAFT_330981 [Leucosporidium creatinivorum]